MKNAIWKGTDFVLEDFGFWVDQLTLHPLQVHPPAGPLAQSSVKDSC